MRDELGASVVEHLVRPSDTDAEVVAALDDAQALGLGVLLHIYDSSTPTDGPWTESGGVWTVTADGARILRAVEGHRALWGVYMLEEPFDYTSDGFVSADGQRVLYTAIKAVADVQLYSDLASIARAVAEGYTVGDGMCDLCCTAPTKWSAGMTETLRRIQDEYDAWHATMDQAQLVYMVNTFGGAGHRMPTAEELREARGRMCELGIPQVYYPWTGYDDNLSNTPELWPVIMEGCGDTPPSPTPTVPPSETPTSVPPSETPTSVPPSETPTSVPPSETPTSVPPSETPTSTHEPPPTDTPEPGDGFVIDHNKVDAIAIPQAWLDVARGASYFFTHKSVGNNIMDGIDDLAAQDPGRYSISVNYSSGTGAGINEYQVGNNQQPYSKINGFAGLVKDGHDAAFMKLCMGDIYPWNSDRATDIWAAYWAMMEEEQAEHPGTTLVWWTIPLITSSRDRSGGNAEKAAFNQAVREHCAANGCILFDIADIEAHTPGGLAVVDAGGNEALYDLYSSDGGHLNETGRQRVASALWWLFARLAGW